MSEQTSVGDRYQHLIEKLPSNQVTLIAVSKNHPVEKVLEAREAGCLDFGENRVQEALPKIAEAPKDIRWHFIGSLQKNKVRKVVGQFYMIHSVDSFDLAEKISDVSLEMGIRSKILLQVNISGETSKRGLSKEDWSDHFPSLLQMKGIDLQGLMTMAPISDSKKSPRFCFSELRKFRDTLQSQYGDALNLHHLSMGMSSDYSVAVDEGATFIRIGSVLFGERRL